MGVCSVRVLFWRWRLEGNVDVVPTLSEADLSQIIDQFKLASQPKLTHRAALLRTNGFHAARQTLRNADQRQAARVQL